MQKFKFKKKREMRYDPEKFLRMEYKGMEILIQHDPLYDGPRKKPTEK
jgi:hypothetical protein